MSDININPFNITKASDFTDKQIKDLWVDYPSGGGFLTLAKPTSPMPMIILGGKGSGKTHLMRYFSFQLQNLRSSHSNLLQKICEEGYIGIYALCGGLNASRFNGKGQTEENWRLLFSFYTDIWLSQLVLKTIEAIYDGNDELHNYVKRICGKIMELFDGKPFTETETIPDVIKLLKSIQKDIDYKVNNCSISRKLDIDILITPSRLIFGIPQILSEILPSLKNIRFLYLIDEFENLNEKQQKYINSLIREKQLPSTFKIGVKMYGFRTRATYCANEEIKEGSEYEKLALDAHFRKKQATKEYKKFITDLCIQRLNKFGFLNSLENKLSNDLNEMSKFFKTTPESRFEFGQTEFISSKYNGNQRPYINHLRNCLKLGMKNKCVIGIKSESDIEKLIGTISVPKFPLLEKLNIFMLYKEWYKGKNLTESSLAIAAQCKQFIENSKLKQQYKTLYSHWKTDLLSQLFRECDQKQKYIGFETFIEMSHGLPRNLLVILKNIFKWSIFNGEDPFSNGVISIESQTLGVKEASEWFLEDARAAGSDGNHIRSSINKLGEFFKECRFADKPIEVCLAGFSVDLSEITEGAQRIIDLAEQWSLLIREFSGQKDRNSKRVDAKYLLNKMLSPIWDLSVARRSITPLKPQEVNAIFDPKYPHEFKELLNKRIQKMNASFKKIKKYAQLTITGDEE